ncbi:MAG: TetR/AcrR family transcriptional regulator [Leptospiraceae bacterium]|nr:TetR/AcrR family transcriptional regulator [Leptospiraceae bacterium]MCP5503090.1 TetR/AcrR family transcriptional regulator [Leptospiraceae bacterium]
MKKNKEGEVRKQEILDTSLQLFETTGYNKTTIQVILNEVGIGKGTFYYYFKSKEEILDTIVRNCFLSEFQSLKKLAEDNSLSAIEKINTLFSHSHEKCEYKRLQLKSRISSILLDEENISLFFKYTKYFFREAKTSYIQIIKQGIQEGSMKTTSASKTTRALLYNMIHQKASLEKKIKKEKDDK